ncbi:hypothetical protein B0T22DRAFT_523758 [Podospora appendiculata]|uniref:Uncharacterized protein n=1 Tax=Podospora appendiculata TaxID=314037 RepID=A0AAE0WYZ3_9PEZI|nr:hypothetical protein B0T22DRAFT_523758 [Podospora appendiculata]
MDKGNDMDVIVMGEPPRCHALNLSDSQPCASVATAYNDLFCNFHAKPCFGLYMGYKRRNAELDALAGKEPAFLRESKTALVSQTFAGVKSESELHEIHDFLFGQYVFLGKVISARKLHHKHFFSVEMDYGHKVYLDKLIGSRRSALKALENLERRTAEVLYEKEKWFGWVREVQNEEETKREKEQKKVKLEAALVKEEKKRQELYLEKVWRERMAAASSAAESSDDDGSAWDPIEDVFEDDRGRYLDLIRHFLWMDQPAPAAQPVAEKTSAEHAIDLAAAAPREGHDSVGEDAMEIEEAEDAATSGQKKKPRKRGGKKKKAKAQPSEGKGDIVPTTDKSKENSDKQQPEPDKDKIETKEDIEKRLKEGVKKDNSHISGPMFVGTQENPRELMDRTAPIRDEDITQLIADITEIKVLLFCRQLMSQSALLPAAVRANSVKEFLADASVSDSDLRDLCLMVEHPSLEALRDACADLTRGDEPDDDDDEDKEDDLDYYRSAAEFIQHHFRYSTLEDSSLSPSLRHGAGAAASHTKKLLAELGADDKRKEAKMKIKICGRSIWNYASQRSMARDGWLQFSIMAKDCDFGAAVEQCRSWGEFFELRALAMWQYFPASKWSGWAGNALHREMTHMGFIPFYIASEGPPRYVQGRIFQSRNFICAHMKRNYPVTRRYIHYALMRPGEHMILVKDGKTGRVIAAPNEEHRWIVRTAFASAAARSGDLDDDEWDEELVVGPDFFEFAERERKWRFGFDEYYTIYMWDFVPDQSHTKMCSSIQEMLIKANRVEGNRCKYTSMKHILETLTREPDTMRVRQIRPGEDVQSLYDALTGPDAQFAIMTTSGKMVITSQDVPAEAGPYDYYNETDAAEDAVLFEEEALGGVPENMPFIEISNPVLHIRDDEPVHTPGVGGFAFDVPPIWAQAHKIIEDTFWDPKRAKLLAKLAFSSVRLKLTFSLSNTAKTLKNRNVLDRDRGYVFKDTFHLGDLEPGGPGRYKESMDMVNSLQKYESPNPNAHGDWTWFCMELLDWLHLKIFDDDYDDENPNSPWPHRFVLQDIVQAFMMMGLFFLNLRETSIIREFLDSEAGKPFKDSRIFDPVSRSKSRPDVRTRASTKARPRKFWEKWDKEVYTGDDLYINAVPKDWNMAIRPIIAKLYRAGMIEPAALEPNPIIVPGFAIASTEPHRPGKLDLFIKYSTVEMFNRGMPPDYIDYKDWPELLPAARKFASSRNNPTSPRFALLRLWSAPHFYPQMVMLPMRQHLSFLDPVGRAWQWKFITKDMPGSEWSVHNTTHLRLGYLRKQLMGLGPYFQSPTSKARGKTWGETRYSAQDKFRHGSSELDDHVLHRVDLILVMGEDEMDLLKWCTTVTM